MTARIREKMGVQKSVEVAEVPVAVPVETIPAPDQKPEEPPVSPPAAVIALPEPFRPMKWPCEDRDKTQAG